MTEQPQGAPPAGMPTFNAVSIASSALSVDGSMAMIVFTDADRGQLGLMMAFERLHTLQHVCSQLAQRQTRRDMPVSSIALRYPHTFSVGHTDQMRGVVCVTFDEKLPTEAIFVLPDETGLNMAEALEQNIYSRMSAQQRHDHARRKHPLLLPTKPTIIMPGGKT